MSSSARTGDWSKDLNTSSPEAQEALKGLIPQLSDKNHKGQLGRLGVLGGSPDYTGAPFFSSSSALRVGADMAYTLTSAEAAPALKGYSPELMVTPVYHAHWPDGVDKGIQEMVDKVTAVLPKMHAMVIGPGLGRDENVFNALEKILEKAKEQGLPMVMDADSLVMVSTRPHTVKGYNRIVLTPNIMEFKRLWEGMGLKEEERKSDEGLKGLAADVERLSEAMGNPIIVLKGAQDVMSDGRTTLICSTAGGLKRCGGLGDILSGAMGTMMAWQSATGSQDTEDEHAQDRRLWGCWWACAINRHATRLAYNKMTRSMSAMDVIAELHEVMESLVPSPKVDESKS